MQKKKKVKYIKVTNDQKTKIRDLVAKGFVFNGKARVCGHCDFSCGD
ncbi:MAG TPA: hypothetical protein P5548_00215 [Candidatus Moranbacteria bacterium]|nr:hypothetical protein [Candidatus Moranbacteria bacterium]HRZ33316.1 hypothetical protein [Candidatus Moranbacteria bacterium]